MQYGQKRIMDIEKSERVDGLVDIIIQKGKVDITHKKYKNGGTHIKAIQKKNFKNRKTQKPKSIKEFADMQYTNIENKHYDLIEHEKILIPAECGECEFFGICPTQIVQQQLQKSGDSWSILHTEHDTNMDIWESNPMIIQKIVRRCIKRDHIEKKIPARDITKKITSIKPTNNSPKYTSYKTYPTLHKNKYPLSPIKPKYQINAGGGDKINVYEKRSYVLHNDKVRNLTWSIRFSVSKNEKINNLEKLKTIYEKLPTKIRKEISFIELSHQFSYLFPKGYFKGYKPA